MLETIAIISNGVVVVAIGALYAKLNSHGKDLNDHKVYVEREIGRRPDFDHLHEEIEKAEKRGCSKMKLLLQAK